MAPPPVLRLHPDDGVLIARVTLLPGAALEHGVTAAERIPAGHKVTMRPHAAGEAIRRYGQIIGFATRRSAPVVTCTCIIAAWAISPKITPIARMRSRPRF